MNRDNLSLKIKERGLEVKIFKNKVQRLETKKSPKKKRLIEFQNCFLSKIEAIVANITGFLQVASQSSFQDEASTRRRNGG